MRSVRGSPFPAPVAALARHAWLGGLAIVLLTFAAHAPSLGNGFIWDDAANVSDNVPLRSLDGLVQIWTDPRATQQCYPLVHTSFWIEYQLWGLAPFHYHFFNVLLHALGAVFLWRCLRLLELPGAFFAACVFALHPVQVESVAWVTERKNVLCGVFYFAAAACLIPVVVGSGGEPRRPRRRYALGCVLFVLALLSKTVACVLGPVLLVLAWWKRGTIGKREFALSAPLFAIGAAGGLLTLFLERDHVGAEGVEWSFGFLDRCVIAARSLVFYVQGLVWPGRRAFIPPRWDIDGKDPLQLGLVLLVVLVLAAFWLLRERIGRGPLAAALIFAGTLFPALGFFDVFAMRYAFAFDHFSYLATPAFIAPCVALVAARVATSGAPLRAAAGVAGALLLAVYGALTARQSTNYRDVETLWRDNIEVSPDSWLPHRHLAGHLLTRGRACEAIEPFEHALRLLPDDVSTWANFAKALRQCGEVDRALEAEREARRLHRDSRKGAGSSG